MNFILSASKCPSRKFTRCAQANNVDTASPPVKQLPSAAQITSQVNSAAADLPRCAGSMDRGAAHIKLIG